jgi:hypothetical protein
MINSGFFGNYPQGEFSCFAGKRLLKKEEKTNFLFFILEVIAIFF